MIPKKQSISCWTTFGVSVRRSPFPKPLPERSMKIGYKVSQHSSGVTIATAEMPHMSSVALGIWVGVGGRFEPAPVCGASHFIEHMLFKGTRRRTARDISQDVEGIGGYLNAFTTEESTCFYAKAAHDQLEHVWNVLGD